LILAIPLFRLAEAIVETILCILGIILILISSIGTLASNGVQAITKLDATGMWKLCRRTPFGDRVYSLFVGFVTPYTASLNFRVVELEEDRCRVKLFDRPWLRNPFGSIHAVALANLGEVTSGLLVYGQLQRRVEGVIRKGIVQKLSATYSSKARGTITASCTDVVLPTTEGQHELRVVTRINDSKGIECAIVEAIWNIRVEPKAVKSQ